ncbi:MAG: hypothetical protein ACRCZF_09575, partial [Gemmataceae bacterium]
MTPAEPQGLAFARWLPWRWSGFGWGLLAILLIHGVPLFLRMPPWCDLTLYDVAAQNIMRGGTHYEDVFDTNLPGFVWLLVIIRRVFGPSLEVVWVIDLVIVSTIVWLLHRAAARVGVERWHRAWMLAGFAFFYLFTSEFNHAQRDVWMLLPALLAVLRRWRRVVDQPSFQWRDGFWDGVLWGLGIWIKPHVLIPTVAIWLVTVRPATAKTTRPWRDAARDGLSLASGGAVVGLLGISWLLLTGTWGPLVDVFEKWNQHYVASMWAEIVHRRWIQATYFPPFSVLVYGALIFGVLNVWDSRPWSRGSEVNRTGPGLAWLPGWLYRPAASHPERLLRGILGMLLLSWAAQAFLFQRMFHYVHVPETILFFAVAALNRWAVVPLAFVYAALGSFLWQLALGQPELRERLERNVTVWNGQFVEVPNHPFFDPERWALWPECFRFGISDEEYYQRMGRAALFGDTFASIDPVETHELSLELRRLGVHDGEVCAWHNAPHAVFAWMKLKPSFRFMHIDTALVAPETYERMKIELIKKQPQIRYVITDLMRVWWLAPERVQPWKQDAGPDGLPPKIPIELRHPWPMRLPVIYRTQEGRGRFLIHLNTRPLTPL